MLRAEATPVVLCIAINNSEDHWRVPHKTDEKWGSVRIPTRNQSGHTPCDLREVIISNEVRRIRSSAVLQFLSPEG